MHNSKSNVIFGFLYALIEKKHLFSPFPQDVENLLGHNVIQECVIRTAYQFQVFLLKNARAVSFDFFDKCSLLLNRIFWFPLVASGPQNPFSNLILLRVLVPILSSLSSQSKQCQVLEHVALRISRTCFDHRLQTLVHLFVFSL